MGSFRATDRHKFRINCCLLFYSYLTCCLRACLAVIQATDCRAETDSTCPWISITNPLDGVLRGGMIAPQVSKFLRAAKSHELWLLLARDLRTSTLSTVVCCRVLQDLKIHHHAQTNKGRGHRTMSHPLSRSCRPRRSSNVSVMTFSVATIAAASSAFSVPSQRLLLGCHIWLSHWHQTLLAAPRKLAMVEVAALMMRTFTARATSQLTIACSCRKGTGSIFVKGIKAAINQKPCTSSLAYKTP